MRETLALLRDFYVYVTRFRSLPGGDDMAEAVQLLLDRAASEGWSEARLPEEE